MVLLEKEPAMAFEILRPVSSPRWSVFDLREDHRTCRRCSIEVSIEVVHVDEHAIDNPGHCRPLACLFTTLLYDSRMKSESWGSSVYAAVAAGF